MNQLRKCLNNIISLYVADFEEKHETELEYWVADDTTGIAAFGDNFFSLADIVYDIDNNCPAGEIFKWQNYCISEHFANKDKTAPNFRSYLLGVR